MFSYFTIAQANAILPDIIKKFEMVMAKKNDVTKIEHQMQSMYKLEDYVTLKQRLNSAMSKFYLAVEELESTGFVLKSIDEGLGDFPSLRFDEEVWLCWKYGETEIKFWHEKDSGFMGRKPLDITNDEALV